MKQPLHESTLRDYFLGLTNGECLDAQTRAAVKVRSRIRKDVHVRDMAEEFLVTRAMILRLCQDAINAHITADSLEDIAFVLLASDSFHFEEESVAEVVHDWSQPRVKCALTSENLLKFCGWLLGNSAYPAHETPPAEVTGTVVSVKRKVVD